MLLFPYIRGNLFFIDEKISSYWNSIIQMCNKSNTGFLYFHNVFKHFIYVTLYKKHALLGLLAGSVSPLAIDLGVVNLGTMLGVEIV